MDRLAQITTLLKSNGINTVASQLKMKKADIYKFLKSNGLVYEDGEVKPILDSNIKNEMAVTKVIQSLNKDIDINKLNELIEMIEPLKQVIQKYNKDINIIEVERVELKPPAVVEVKRKLFKIDTTVLDNWNDFTSKHKELKIESLISLALQEFIDKYK